MEEKYSRRKEIILNTVINILENTDYAHLTIEEIAARAGVGKSTIYRWWKHKSELVFEAFKYHTTSTFHLDIHQSIKSNLIQQLQILSQALHHGVGRALLVAMVEYREEVGELFHQYLLPYREQTSELIDIAIQNGKIKADYPYALMLDTLYASIHYQIIFFNRLPDDAYIHALVYMILEPVCLSV